ncbi:unnamed protein product [Amaranthus hypochondriacus]
MIQLQNVNGFETRISHEDEDDDADSNIVHVDNHYKQQQKKAKKNAAKAYNPNAVTKNVTHQTRKSLNKKVIID